MTKKLEDTYAGAADVVIFHLQTVFEGESENTPERGPKEAEKYGIRAPVGYDAHLDGAPVSTLMASYGTGGTPWSIVIDKQGIVRHSSVTPEGVVLDRVVENLRAE